jgi:hypothetical protein
MRTIIATLLLCAVNALAQIPVATQTLLDAVRSPESKSVIKSVLRIECLMDNGKGTGFVVSSTGFVVTNSHVIGHCAAVDLTAVSPVTEEPIKFSSMVKDDNRDLALLCPTKTLPALRLSEDDQAPVETEVETWGYPLRYNLTAPVLSRGYIAGYDEGLDSQGHLKNPRVNHLIVNGAFNPGNSGGPLIDKATGKVVGIVVEKWGLYSPFVEKAIAGLQHATATTSSGLSYVDPTTGRTITLMNEQVTALALQELYNASQVMMGEAISVSELNAFIKEKKKDLVCGTQAGRGK